MSREALLGRGIVRGWRDGGTAEASFSPEPKSAADVRQFVAKHCNNWSIGEQPTELATLLCDELASNVIQHVQTPFLVRLGRTASSLDAAVLDGSTDLPVRLAPSMDRMGGRGIYLLDQLASSWGFERTPYGKALWFSLLLIPEPTTDSGRDIG